MNSSSDRRWLMQWTHYVRAAEHPTWFVKNMSALHELRRGKPAVVRFGKYNLRLKIPTLLDAWVAFETIYLEQYREAYEEGPRVRTVVDIGGAAGDFALLMRRRFPQAKVVSIEPNPFACELFRENMGLNGETDIQLLEAAVGDGDMVPVMAQAVGAISVGRTASAGDKAVKVARPTCHMTLSQVFDSCGLKSVDLLKIDCEGGEYSILNSAGRDVLQRCQRICLEYHDHGRGRDVGDLERLLISSGFTIKREPCAVHRANGLIFAVREF